MVHFIPFKALRPQEKYAADFCTPPYDVLSPEDVKTLYAKSPISFARVIRSEEDTEEPTDMYASRVYDKAAENLNKFINDGVLLQDETPCYYIYSQTADGRTQTGICGLVTVDDYKDNYIKKHELTLPEKENDRLDHFMACGAHTEPIFLMCKPDDAFRWFVSRITNETKPQYDFDDAAGVNHKLWRVDNPGDIESLMMIMQGHEAFYIADGHHRTASAARVSDALGSPGDIGDEEYNFFMAVVFPADELNIMDYNRLLTDFCGLTESEFFEKLDKDFEINETAEFKKPPLEHMISLYTGGKSYRLVIRPESYDSENAAESIDAYILQKNVFDKILGIKDPTRSEKLKFVGGIKGYAPLKEAVDSGSMKAAFGMYPVSYTEILRVADNKQIMPPKSTWFEPKLISGLFIHKFK